MLSMGFDLNSMSFNCWSSSLKCLVAHAYLKYTACALETTVLMRSRLRNKLLSCCSCGLQNSLRVWGHGLQLSGGKTWTQFDSCRKKYIQLTDTAEPWLSKRNYFLPTSSLNKVRIQFHFGTHLGILDCVNLANARLHMLLPVV